MTSYRDWVVETSSTTGTGSYALSGSAPAGTSYFTFRQRYANGDDEVVYWVVNQNRTKWEKNRFGTLTYGTPDTLSRNVVESTNGDAPVSWVGGDGPLLVYVAPDAEAQEFAISMGLGASRPGVLKFGLWADEDAGGADIHELKLFDGTSDFLIGRIDANTHTFRIDEGVAGQTVGVTTSGVATGTTLVPIDDTIPQNTEGDQYLSLAITPKSAASTLYIEAYVYGSSSTQDNVAIALFKDSDANALAASTKGVLITTPDTWIVRHKMTSGTTGAITFKVRVGKANAGTFTLNGIAGARLLGGVAHSGMKIREVL